MRWMGHSWIIRSQLVKHRSIGQISSLRPRCMMHIKESLVGRPQLRLEEELQACGVAKVFYLRASDKEGWEIAGSLLQLLLWLNIRKELKLFLSMTFIAQVVLSRSSCIIWGYHSQKQQMIDFQSAPLATQSTLVHRQMGPGGCLYQRKPTLK